MVDEWEQRWVVGLVGRMAVDWVEQRDTLSAALKAALMVACSDDDLVARLVGV